LWSVLRAELPRYGFGRAEALPIRKTGEAVACYVAKYVEKNLFNRTEEDKRKKLVRYSGFQRHLKPNDFGWASARACAWRRNAEALASLAGVETRDEAAQCFGPRWAFGLSRIMNAVAGDDISRFDAEKWDYPTRSIVRQFVLREAKTRWVLARQASNRRSPIEWRPDFEAINEARYQRRAPLLFSMS
jgi:hypothetical protein